MPVDSYFQGITDLFDQPYYTGTGGTTGLVPQPYSIAIAGRPYVVDFEFTPFRREAYRHKSIPITRTQADTNGVPGEHTLNPAGLWRRSQETWGHGAGQIYLDRATSDSARFRYSKGMDPWTPYELQLLNTTALGYSTAGTNLRLAVTAANLWFIDGTNLRFTASPFAGPPMTVTSQGVGTAYDLTSDGYDVYAATSTGIWTANDGNTTVSQYGTTGLAATAKIGYVLGRLMVANGPSIYNVTGSGALPAALLTHANANFIWVGFAAGNGYIFAAGNAGAMGLIYKITIQPDGTALTAPSVSCQLPKGEMVQAITGYLGLVLVGTNLGVRVATADASGNLTLGALITTTSGVQCFEPQGRFSWYGLTNFDISSTGLGRMDLSTLGALSNAPGTPAWASDLMSSNQGAVTSIASFLNGTYGYNRLYAVSGIGIIVENPMAAVAQGVMQTGFITYDMSDFKYGVFIDILPGPFPGTISAALSNDGLPFVSCGTSTVHNSSLIEFPTPQTECNTLEVQYTMTSLGAQPQSCYIHRSTLRSMVATRSSTQFIIPIRLSVEESVADIETPFVPSVEIAFLDSLRKTRSITTFQEGNASYAVTIDDLDWTPDRITRDGAEMAGVLVVTMTTIS